MSFISGFPSGSTGGGSGTGEEAVEFGKVEEVWELTRSSLIVCLDTDAEGNVCFGDGYGDKYAPSGICKFSPEGTQIWYYAGSSSVADYPYSLVVDASGCVYSGWTKHSVRKISPGGTEVWRYTGHTKNVGAIAVDSSGYIYSGGWDGTVRKISPGGVEVWRYVDSSLTAGGSPPSVNGVCVDAPGGIYSAWSDGSVRKIGPDSTEIWRFVAVEKSSAFWIVLSLNGSFCVGLSDYAIHKYAADQTEVWRYVDERVPPQYPVCGAADVWGCVYSGWGYKTVCKLNPDGTEIWHYGCPEYPQSIKADGSRGVYVGRYPHHLRKLSNPAAGKLYTDSNAYDINWIQKTDVPNQYLISYR